MSGGEAPPPETDEAGGEEGMGASVRESRQLGLGLGGIAGTAERVAVPEEHVALECCGRTAGDQLGPRPLCIAMPGMFMPRSNFTVPTSTNWSFASRNSMRTSFRVF